MEGSINGQNQSEITILPQQQTPPSNNQKKRFRIFLFHNKYVLVSAGAAVFVIIVCILTFMLLSHSSRENKKGAIANNSKNALSDSKNYYPSQPPQKISTTPAFQSDPILGDTFKNHYGEYAIKYPSGWSHQTCGGEGVFPDSCISFSPGRSSDGIVYLTANQTDDNDQYSYFGSSGYQIPALGKDKAGMSIDVSFSHNGVSYVLSGDYGNGEKYHYTMDDVDQLVQKMAQSFNFLNEPYSCTAPALTPLKSFPDSFSLSNMHDSDGSDSVTGTWPFTTPGAHEDSQGTTRAFIVSYVKSGAPFIPNSPLVATQTALKGDSDHLGSGPSEETQIMHINCINSPQEGLGDPFVYLVGVSYYDPFYIQLFAGRQNMTTLENSAKWNVNLLKSTRNIIYMELGTGDEWQTYTAQEYVVDDPAAYGG